MSFCLGQGVYFLHCPKTGGTWVRRACKAAGLPVTTYIAQHDERVPPSARFTFTIIRDHADWLSSFWRHNAAKGWKSFPRHWDNVKTAPTHRLWLLGRSMPSAPFTDYVEAVLETMPGCISEEFARYTREADFVGRTETLQHDTDYALSLAGLSYSRERIVSQPPANIARYQWVDYAPGQVARLRAAESL
jgi:hypothetical protein